MESINSYAIWNTHPSPGLGIFENWDTVLNGDMYIVY